MASVEIMLRNVDKLKEEVFKKSSRPRLNKELFKCKYGAGFVYVVYTEDKRLLVDFHGIQKFKPRLGGNFKKQLTYFIKLYKPTSFKDFLFFMGAFPLSRQNPSISELPRWKFRKYEIIDLALSESKGFLLWDYQLKSLLNIFWDLSWKQMKEEIESNPLYITTNDPYRNLELGLSLKRSYYWNLMKKLKFSKGLTMYDVLKERMIRGAVYSPNIERAYLLYKVIT